MIPDLCNWIYDYAASWLPSFLLDGDEETAETDDGTTAPGTVAALARAREALNEMEHTPPGLRSAAMDARFRPAGVDAVLGGVVGVQRLVMRLGELDVGALGPGDREALLGAAKGLVARLQQ